MEQVEKKTVNQLMRALHRDIGFFIIGLTIIYSISGIILIYRDTSFLKHETLIEKKLSPNLQASELSGALHLRDFKVLKSEGDLLFFKNGTYNNITGVVKYSTQELPLWLSKFSELHKSSSKSAIHWFTTIFGILLLFLAISSFWMFKPSTKLFRRAIFIASAGIVGAIILLII